MRSSPLLLASTILPWAPLAAAHAADSSRPNIVFILADDLGYMDIGANNPKTFYETPSIDRLAREGMRFTSGYAACPVCSPTRASIMTGKYPARLGITDWIRRGSGVHLALEEVTVAEALRGAGYTNFFAGKWHLGEGEFGPAAHGFAPDLRGAGEFYYPPETTPRREGDFKSSDRIADEAVRFIEANKDKRFFAYLPFLAVHVPIQARADLVEKYQRKLASSAPGAWGGQTNCAYAAMLEQMDSGIGRVLDALDRLNLAERTIVIFMSDNGGFDKVATSNLPLRGGKGHPYEGGIREPWIVRAPGMTRPDSVCDTPVTSTDFYPTILELAGLSPMPQQHVDGMSFVPLLKGQPLARGPLYWHYPHNWMACRPAGAIREGDWKLIEHFTTKEIELFNLREDLGETKNLASQNPAKVAELKGKLAAWRVEVKARTSGAEPGTADHATEGTEFPTSRRAAEGGKPPAAAADREWEKLAGQWKTPDWIQDAKLGFWAHWGPQSVPRLGGGWYARHMYMPEVGKDGKEKWGMNAYRYHVATYGHPSEYGYKDLIHDHFKAEKFDAEALVRQFKDWGARYVAMMANHHDNFDLFPTSVHDWNSVNVGPKRDLVGEFAAAARKHGLPWAASVHVGRMFFPPPGTADPSGPKAGMPYDLALTKAEGKGRWWEGLDPRDLYGQPKNFGKRTLELVQNYRPDMIYFDRMDLPQKDVLARYYQESLERKGSIQAIVTVKKPAAGAMLDVERGQTENLQESAWQADTTMFNGWFRKEDEGDKNLRFDTRCLIEMLTDVVSKNGVFLLNVALYGDGSIPADQAKELQGLADWLKINGEAIYAARPWKIYGVGGQTRAGHFSERTRHGSQPWGADVLRFTRSKDNRTLYVFTYGVQPGQEIVIAPFTGNFESVSLVGVEGTLPAKMEPGGLRVQLPAALPSPVGNVIRVKTGGL
jgi:arylsulfatase A-like enzyme/alpha-L-fucosidase